MHRAQRSRYIEIRVSELAGLAVGFDRQTRAPASSDGARAGLVNGSENWLHGAAVALRGLKVVVMSPCSGTACSSFGSAGVPGMTSSAELVSELVELIA